MRGLILALILASATCLCAQEFPYQDNDSPAWSKSMYSATNEAEASEAVQYYEENFSNQPFVKSQHTQYYKRWLRSLTRGIDSYASGNSSLETVAKNRKLYLEKYQINRRSKSNNSSWSSLGPYDYDDGAAVRSYAPGAAHIYTIEQSRSNGNVLLAGTATAGVWKSSDKGNSWTLITKDLLVNEVKAVEIDKTNPSNIFFGGGGYFYKSTNGGASWLKKTVSSAGVVITDIVQHLSKPSTLFIATDRGLYRSTNAGNSWTSVISAGSAQESILEIEVHPTNADIIYAVKSISNRTLFYKSTNGGSSFTQKTNGWPNPNTETNAHQRRTEIAVTPAHPKYIYALAAGQANGGSGLYGFYLSTDEGETWSFTCCGDKPGGVPNSANNKNILGYSTTGAQDGGQYYYDLALAVSETTPVWIVAGGINLWRSTNHGAGWTCNGGWTYTGNGSKYVHSDIHDLRFFGNDFWIASDGGSYYSTNKGASVTKKMFGIQGTDFKGFGAGQTNPDLMIGGTYHNSTLLKYGNIYQGGWVSTALGGTGGDNNRGFVNPALDNVAYIDKSGNNGRIEISSNRDDPFEQHLFAKQPNASYTTGNSCNLAYDPRYYTHIYSGDLDDLWKTEDNGETWELIKSFGSGKVVSIDVATSNPNYIYAVVTPAATNGSTSLWKSTDAGDTWNKITPSNITSHKNYPMQVQVSAYDPNKLWLARIPPFTTSNALNGQKIFTSNNGGSSWINISSSGLSGEMITNIMHQKGTSGIYAGTRRAVYYKDETMSSWVAYNNDLPASTYSTRLVPFYFGAKIRNGTNRGAYEAPFYKSSAPLAIPSVDKSQGSCSDNTFHFKDLSTISSSGAKWEWSFPGGTPSSSILRSPIVKYTNSGSYDVTLKVTNQNGSHTQTTTDMVAIEAGCGSVAPDGFVGNALKTIGSNGFAEIDPLDKNTNNISVTAWVKLQSNPTGDASIIHWEAGSNDTGFYIDPDRKLKYRWKGGGSNLSSGLEVPLDMWTHVAFVVKSNAVSFFLNGIEKTIPTSHSNNFFSGTAEIGSIANNNAVSINGQIDELTIWEIPLSVDDIRRQRHITLDGGPYGGLIAYYQFNETGQQIIDKAGAYSGSLKNNASIVPSTAPLGGGISEMVYVRGPAGIDQNNYPQGDFVITRISGQPDYSPMVGPHSNDYWIVNNYSDKMNFGPIDMLRFEGIGPISNNESNNPQQLVLLKRDSNYDGDSWGSPVANADLAISGNMGDVQFSYTNEITTFSQFFISRTTVLPVELLSFAVREISNESVQIEWSSVNEENLDRYEVERSLDGESFEMIGYAFAIGSLEETKYDFTDYAPEIGLNYYRLKSIDNDGSVSYSTVQSAVISDENNSSFEVYPNPANDHVNVIINATDKNETMILLYNQSGQKIVEALIDQDLRLDVSKLTAGMYHLVLQNKFQRENHKLIIQ